MGFVFPGQGSQTPGMGKDLYDNYKSCKEIFEKANEILGFDLKQICFEGSKEELTKTEITQPALYTVSSAAFIALNENKKLMIDAYAGHSLGEYSAYFAAGYLTFEDGLKAVRKRGLLMSEADPEGKGTMASILKLEENIVKEICEKASTEGVVVPANFNSPGQIVISGEKNAIKKAIELTTEYKGRAMPLVVGGAFHSPLMKPASEKLGQFLENINLSDSKNKVISNVFADIVEFNNIKDSLVKQLTSPVKWIDSIQKMIEYGVDTIIEIGSGSVLQGLIKRIDPKIRCFGISDKDSLEKTLKEI